LAGPRPPRPRQQQGTELGEALVEVADGIAEDVRTFEAIMRTLGIRPNPAKVALAAAGERFGRLKRNGRWVSYSPLSRFPELEALAMGIEGKKILWHTLGQLAELRDRLPGTDFDELLARAARQRQTGCRTASGWFRSARRARTRGVRARPRRRATGPTRPRRVRHVRPLRAAHAERSGRRPRAAAPWFPWPPTPH
jgi:hypothetical protein